jgi:hypothetical protein
MTIEIRNGGVYLTAQAEGHFGIIKVIAMVATRSDQLILEKVALRPVRPIPGDWISAFRGS